LSDTYTFAEVGAAQRQEFILSWERSFQRQLPTPVYDWIFNGTNLLFAAFTGPDICAGYGLYPLEAVWQGTPSRILLCNNVFVDPAHQGKMLFSRLGRFALRAAGERGFPLAYGIPNQNAVPGHRRVGWQLQPPVQFLARRRGGGSKSNVGWTQAAPSAQTLQAVEDCSRRSASDRTFSVVKTSEFFRWRYLTRPGIQYWYASLGSGSRIGAYAVAKYYADKRCLHIIDLDGDDTSAIDSLIASIDTISEPFEYVNLWSTTAHRSLFEQQGFASNDESNMLIFIRPSDLKGVSVDAGVHLVLGDNDVY